MEEGYVVFVYGKFQIFFFYGVVYCFEGSDEVRCFYLLGGFQQFVKENVQGFWLIINFLVGVCMLQGFCDVGVGVNGNVILFQVLFKVVRDFIWVNELLCVFWFEKEVVDGDWIVFYVVVVDVEELGDFVQGSDQVIRIFFYFIVYGIEFISLGLFCVFLFQFENFIIGQWWVVCL